MKIKNVGIILVVLLIGLVVFNFNKNKTKLEPVDNTDDSVPAVSENTTQQPVIEMSTGPVFTDNEFGFQMTFTDAWKGYGFEKAKNSIDWNYTSIVFEMPISIDKPSDFVKLFALRIFPKSEYYKIPKYVREQGWADDAPGIYVVEDQNYVVTWDSIPQDGITSDIRKLLDSIPLILKTFKFNK